MKLAIVLGTRPEIIKLSPVIRECVTRHLDYVLIHTNQHFSPEMDAIFFQELALPAPHYNLGAYRVSGQAGMVGHILTALEPILLAEKPDWVIVQGDTNSVVAGALAASKLGLKIGHVEAGLRSYDRTMPEEINRIVTDHLADHLYCPSATQAEILRHEGIANDKIIVTGNTIVDAVHQNLALATRSVDRSVLPSTPYMLLTLHRPSNVDTVETLVPLLQALVATAAAQDLPIIFPVHPRTEATLDRAEPKWCETPYLRLQKPVGYLHMLALEQQAALILTDSGGLQEEACILHVPCVTLRENTERPETIQVGANRLFGGLTSLASTVKEMLAVPRDWPIPFGEPGVSAQIIRALTGS